MSASLSWHLERLPPSDGLGRHRDAWDRLNQQLMAGHAMLDSQFVEPMLRHFAPPGVQLAIGTRDGQVAAMVVLNAHARGLGVWATFLPSQAQIGLALIPPDGDVTGLFAQLPGYASELDLLCNDGRFVDFRSLAGHPPKRSLPHSLTMNVNLRGSFDDYWAQRPRKLIQNMRRYLRRLQTESPIDGLRVITTAADMPAAVARYAELEGRGWKGREGTAVQAGTPQGQFYVDVLSRFAERDQALVYELWLGDVLLASRLLLLRGDMAVMLKTAFDEQFERFAPGRILLLKTLEDLFSRIPGGVVEFYTNAEADLLAWSTSQRWIHHVSFYRHTGLPVLFAALRRSTRIWRAKKKPRHIDTDFMVERSGSIVETFKHPRDLPDDARALLRRQEDAYVEFGADWFGLLADTVFRGESQVVLYVLRRQGRALAVLPVGVQDSGAGIEIGALANYYTTLYSPALAADLSAEDLMPLLVALRRQHRAYAYRFWPMDPTAKEFGLLRDALRLAGLQAHEYFAFGNWYLQVNSDWADYLKHRSGQLRSTIKRMTKRLAAEPGGRLEIIQDAADVDRGIAAYEAVYGASWKVPEPYPEFIPGLIRLCARRGWLRLGIAWIGDQPIAAQLWIVNGSRAHIYKVAYDENFKHIAPGTLVTALLLEQAIDRDQVTEVDYLIGDDAYKKTWMSHRRERFGLIAYDPATLRGLYGLGRQAIGNAWRRLRSTVSQRSLPPDNSTA